MGQVTYIMMLLAAVCTAVVLVLGIACMLRGGDVNRKYGNRLMQARVVFQGLALFFFAAAMMS